MPRIDVHQTSRHAVLVLHVHGLDASSISTALSVNKDSFQINYLDPSTRSKVNVTVRPQLLQQPVDIHEPSRALIQDCTCSSALENTVFKFAKLQAIEWQALQLTFKSVAAQLSSSETEAEAEVERSKDIKTDVDQKEHSTLEESVTLKFVTEANVGQLHDAIRASQLWEREHEQHVGNVQARRVPGMNAIHMTAELVSNVSSSSS
ncbi:hypothetical protein BGZ75_003939 [Mortierella antarctica]|nr:hypothetical protein BGZ67_004547 [Mortierella alpina]KAF9984486.1 hypothetical protein BGZ75_003939 [Mortierella antarctica]